MKKGYKFPRDGNCPYCGVELARNWYVRHVREQHPERCDPIWGNCTYCGEDMNDIHTPPHRLELTALGKEYKLCDDCYGIALKRMSAFWDWLWSEELEEETEEETNVAR